MFTVIECGYKHEKRAFGQVKVGYKGVGDLEFVARIYEYSGVGAHCMQHSAVIRSAFKRAAGGGSDGDYPSACGASFVDYACGLLADREIFCMHHML